MKRRKLPLNALRAFESSARLGSQMAASFELGVTHGAISRQIRVLEEFLGLQVFEGSRSNPILTPVGEKLALRMTSTLDEMDAAVHECLNDGTSTIDLACLSSFAMRWLIPRLHSFYKLNPNIDVRLNTNDQKTARLSARFDLLITVLGPNEKMTSTDVMLFDEFLGVVMAPSLVHTQAITSIEDLDRTPCLRTQTRLNAWEIWRESSNSVGVEKKKNATIDYEHYSFALEAAASGLGACATPLHLVTNDLKSGRLVAPFGFIGTGYRYIARQKRWPNKQTAILCSWLKAETMRDLSPHPLPG